MQDLQLTVGQKTYERFQETPDKTTYVSGTHSVSNVDILLLGRTVPSNIDGAGKIRANLVQDCKVGTGLDERNVGRAYANAEVSVPVQASDASRAALLKDFRAYVASDSFSQLFNKQSI